MITSWVKVKTTYRGIIMATLGKTWATFYFTIWSHCS